MYIVKKVRLDDPKNNLSGDLLSLSSALKNFFSEGNFKHSDHMFALRLWHYWPKLVQNNLFKDCRPVSFQQGRLTLWISSAAEMQEIHFHTEELKQQINEYFTTDLVHTIHFTFNRDILSRRERTIHSVAKLF